MQRFKSPGLAQRFLSIHATVHNHFNTRHHLITTTKDREFRARARDNGGTALRQKHAVESFLARDTAVDLKTIVDGRTLDYPRRSFNDFRNFAEARRRHIAWQDGVVLPLAHDWLSPKDLEEMGRNMAARRGATCPEWAACRKGYWSTVAGTDPSSTNCDRETKSELILINARKSGDSDYSQ